MRPKLPTPAPTPMARVLLSESVEVGEDGGLGLSVDTVGSPSDTGMDPLGESVGLGSSVEVVESGSLVGDVASDSVVDVAGSDSVVEAG